MIKLSDDDESHVAYDEESGSIEIQRKTADGTVLAALMPVEVVIELLSLAGFEVKPR